MPKKLNATEEQIKTLVELEEVLCCLDQHATGQTAPGRAYLRYYTELLVILDAELEGWNNEEDWMRFLAPGLQKIYRCDKAVKPWHSTDYDGPCEIYTANVSGRCDLHEAEGK